MEMLKSTIAIVLASTFLLSGASKLFSPDVFAKSARSVLGSVLPETFPVATLTRTIGGFEVLVAIFLPFPRTAFAGTLASGILGISFVAWAGAAMVRGVHVPCGCFGGARSSTLGPRNVAAGILIAILSTFMLVSPRFVLDPAVMLSAACLLSLTAAIVPSLKSAFQILRRGLSWR